MADRRPFPDIEVALADLFVDLVADENHSVTDVPPNLQAMLPLIRVERIGGDDDGFTDSALVAIDAFAALRADARNLAEAIRQRLLSCLIAVVDGVQLDYASTATAPNEVPWSDDQTVRRFTATYRVTARRTPAS